MIATLWMPGLNPIGPGSLVPLCVVVLAACIAAALGRTWIVLATVAFAAAAVLNPFPLASRSYPDADDIVGFYIWAMAACWWALEVARFGSLRALCFGCAVLFPMGWLLAFEAISRVAQIDPDYRLWRGDLIARYSLCIWLAIFAFIVHRAARPWLQQRRLAPGLCRKCGYDLRASPTRCPECGEMVDANVAE